MDFQFRLALELKHDVALENVDAEEEQENEGTQYDASLGQEGWQHQGSENEGGADNSQCEHE